MTAPRPRWRVQFCASPLLPGHMRYGRVENKAAGLTTVNAARFRVLQAWWRERYGTPVETVTGAVTVWEFAPVKGMRFDLKPPGEWGVTAGNAAWTEFRNCEG
jgi:hypothetical protein